METTASPGDVIQGYTKFNNASDQKMLYSYKLKGGVTLNDPVTLFNDGDVSSSTIYEYSGDYLDYTMVLTGKQEVADTGDQVQSYTKFDGTSQQKMEYTYNLKGGTLLGDPITTFLEEDVSTSTVYSYTGDYLDWSMVLKGKHEIAQEDDEVQSFTKFDLSPEQKMLYTYKLKGGTLLASTVTDFLAKDVNTSTIYNYTGDYLDWSMVLRGKHEIAQKDDEVQSFTKFDGSSDQKMRYTYSFKGGKTLRDPITDFLEEDINTSTIYSYKGDYLDYSMVLKGMHQIAETGNEIQSYTKFDETTEQRMKYSYSFKGGITLGATITVFNPNDINTSTIYTYSGDYLDYSMVLKGMHETAEIGDPVQSFTKFNVSAEQKMLYTYRFKGGVTLNDPVTLFLDGDVSTSTIYSYSGDYLDWSMVLKGKHEIAQEDDEIQSFTKFDVSLAQKMKYTYSFRGGAKLKADLTDFDAKDVNTSTVYSYSGDYLDWSMVLKGKKEIAEPGNAIQSYTKFDVSPEQKMVYSYSFKGGVTLGDPITTFLPESVNTSTIYTYTGDYLDYSMVLKGKHEKALGGEEIQSYTKFDGTNDQKMLYTYSFKGGVTLALPPNLTVFSADDVNTSTVYTYDGDYLDYSMVLKGMHQTAETGNEIQSFTKFDVSPEQKMKYTYSFFGGTLLGDPVTTFASAKVNTSTIYSYSGDYLDYSMVLKGKHEEARTDDEVLSYTKFDGSTYQKMLYTYSFREDVVLGADITVFVEADILTSTIYSYLGDYLDYTMVLKGKKESAKEGDIIQSFTRFDGTADQKMRYTYTFKGGTALGADIDVFIADDVYTSTVYSYLGDYLDYTMLLRGKHETPQAGDIVQSYTKYDNTRDQKMVYTYNFKGGTVLKATVTDFDDASIASSSVYSYKGDYLDYSMLLDGRHEEALPGDRVRSFTKFDETSDQRMVYTYAFRRYTDLRDPVTDFLSTSIKTTTVFTYGAGNAMKSAITYRGNTGLVIDGVNVTATASAIKKVVVYYKGTAGQELQDWSQQYSIDGLRVKNTTIYEYGTGADDDPEDCLRRTITYDDSTIRTVKPTFPDSAIRNITVFVGNNKGSEVSNYTIDFTTGKTTFYFYGDAEEADGVRADQATAGQQMVRSVVYRTVPEADADITIDFDRDGVPDRFFSSAKLHTVTYFQLTGEKGEERAWYNYSYLTDGTTIRSTTIFFYETTGEMEYQRMTA